jgi:flagellar biogenesis protein FliO
MEPGFWVKYILLLVVVGLMLFGLYAILRGLSRGRLLATTDPRLISVVESIFVSQNTTLHVVKIGSQYLLVGGGVGHLATLGELPAEDVETWIADQRRLHANHLQPLAGLIEHLRGKKS